MTSTLIAATATVAAAGLVVVAIGLLGNLAAVVVAFCAGLTIGAFGWSGR